MEKVLVRPNPTREKTLDIMPTIISAIYRYGFKVFIGEQFKEQLAASLGEKATFCTEEAGLDQCDFALVIGGDGTILRIAQAAAVRKKPVLGINVGTLGFMSELEVQELWEMEKLRKGDFWLDTRMMINVRVVDPQGNTVFEAEGLNDAVISKGVVSRVIRLYVYVDDKETIRLSSDGIIVCTPTGSTAYSLSAGGPILEPSSDCLAVTPICPHSLGAKSFVLGADKVIRITPPPQENAVYLSVDGFQSCVVAPGNSILIRRSPITFSLIRIKGLGFYEVVSKKLSNERVEI